MQVKKGYVYLMMNKTRTVIYTGVTSNLPQRISQHKEDVIEGFTKKYKTHDLVYYEIFDSITEAIAREKQIKAGSRKKKIDLIKSVNPTFKDLSQTL